MMIVGTRNACAHLFCGSLIDGSGGRIQERVMVGIKGGVITAISGNNAGKHLPPGAIDWSDCTLLPGLVDCHVHLFMSGTADPSIRSSQLRYTFNEARPIIVSHLTDQIRHGIVALRDGGDYGGHALRFKSEGMPGMRNHIVINCSGRAWHGPGRYGRLIGRTPENDLSLAQSISSDPDSPDQIKIVNSGINSLTEFGKETRPQFSLQELMKAVKAAEHLGLKAMVHANGRLPVDAAAQAGCHSIEHGYFMGENNLRLLADRRIYWIPTAYTMKAYSRLVKKGSGEAHIALKNLDHQLNQIRLAREIGVPMAIGTDCGSLGVHHGDAFSEEMRLFVEAGFTIPEVVRLATVSGAQLLGIDHEIGELKVGSPATFVVLKGNPADMFDSLKSPERVYFKAMRID
ncbi:MAG: amidohydrolase family protein [Dissulfurispiraceae bacterium]